MINIWNRVVNVISHKEMDMDVDESKVMPQDE